MTSRMTKFADAIGNAFAAAGAAAVALMMVHICLDVAIRVALRIPIYGTIEIASKYMMVIIAFAPIAEIQRRRGHLFVESFTAMVPAKGNRLLDFIVIFYFFGLACLYLYAAATKAIEKTAVRAAVETPAFTIPLWPSYWVIPIALAALLVVLLAQIMSGPTNVPTHSDELLPHD